MLTLNVGFNRKTGEANYGSRGASVNLELECEGFLASEPERLKERIRSLFALAKASVEEELNVTAAQSGNGHAANGNGNGQRRSAGRRATASQIRALHAIADRQQLDLPAALRNQFGVDKPEDLSITEASSLIDGLKASTNGNGQERHR